MGKPKKNTEQLGSIFDAQPSQLVGNIHNLKDASEPVIGYVSVTNIQSKRFYINRYDLPNTWTYEYPYECGEPLEAFFKTGPNGTDNTVEQYIIRGGSVPLSDISIQLTIIGYKYSTVQCADCTIRGTVKKPSFWVDSK